MKVFQDLTIRGSRAELEQFVLEVERRLSDGWARNHTLEGNATPPKIFGPWFCFSCSGTSDRPACDLWISARFNGEMFVSNIMPREQHKLTYDQYNAVLREFYEHFAGPAAEAAPVQIELGRAEESLEDYLTPATARLLRGFAQSANKWGLHPLDRQRWNEFLAAAYREHAHLTSSTLKRWLQEEENWPRERASELASEYENGRELLEVYESLQA